MRNTVLGLDLGTNSIGWALFEADEAKRPMALIDLGVRIFPQAIEDKTKVPKNKARRDARLTRRVLQRRARRKQRMMNYLIAFNLLPQNLSDHPQPEILLNQLGDPYELRTRGLDQALTSHELGRVLLHLVQRRGFQSNRKTLLGDMIDDPDVVTVFADDGEMDSQEDTNFKQAIAQLKQHIQATNCRTLGEYLHQLPQGQVKRNRAREGGHLRTDRQMYKDEFWAILATQKVHHPILEDIQTELFEIIFFQRPLKLKKDRVGKCSLEPRNTRAKKSCQAFQRFRYLQDINSLKYFDSYSKQTHVLTDDDRQKLTVLFEKTAKPSITQIKNTLGLSKNQQLNFEGVSNKKFKGNLTAIAIREVYPEWDNLDGATQQQLEDDLITFQSKKALKKRLQTHWQLDASTALQLAIVEFEPEHADLSLKAIHKLLPYLEQGQMYSDARQSAGYGYDIIETKPLDKLPSPPDLPNPIVNKGLHELKRVVNAIIKTHGKPSAIRLEMARDLEMNTERYKAFIRQQNKNTKQNEEAQQQFQSIAKANPHLGLSQYASHTDKLKYRLWQEQEQRCAYSQKHIPQSELFTGQIEIDHILPFSLTLNDSYMNKVVCYANENQLKGQRTPCEAFAGQGEKWQQIEGAIQRWYAKGLAAKRDAFYKTTDDLDSDFINSQLTDTRYISREALHYLKQLGCDISTVKGQVTSWLRHIWGMNSLIKDKKTEKDRTDHRHHAIDAAVIACIDRTLYQGIVKTASNLEKQQSGLHIKDIPVGMLYADFKSQLAKKLDTLIIAHASDKKLSGALHEDTGLGFIPTLGTVYRKNLDSNISRKAIEDIIDPTVKTLVQTHLAKHGNNPKQAFTPDTPVLHKDGKTPIKRVRILQSKARLEELEQSKLGIKNREGNVFKWLTLGNNHHMEVFKHKTKPKYTFRNISTLEATRRIHAKSSAVNTQYDDDYDFCFALHRNDLVTIELDEKTAIYRVQKFDAGKTHFRLHTAATLDNPQEVIAKSVSSLLKNNAIQPIKINVLGKRLDD